MAAPKKKAKSKKKSNAGRPTVFIKDVLDKLQLAFCSGANDATACFYAGISDDALYKYQRAQKETWKNWTDFRALANISRAIEADDNGHYSLDYAKAKIPAFKNKAVNLTADVEMGEKTRELLDTLTNSTAEKIWQK